MSAAAPVAALPRTLASRRLNTRTLFGAFLAIAGAALVLTLVRASQPHTVDVVRAQRDVPAGTVLQAGDLAPVSLALPEDVAATLVAASERDALVGRALGQPLNAGDLVTRRQAVPAPERIPAGQRVYTIPVGPETAAGGQLKAGDAVEVVVSIGKADQQSARTEVVLDRAQVYAVGRDDGGSASTLFATGDPSAAGPRHLAWVAVLVTDDQFQALAKARRSGDLDLAILPPVGEA